MLEETVKDSEDILHLYKKKKFLQNFPILPVGVMIIRKFSSTERQKRQVGNQSGKYTYIYKDLCLTSECWRMGRTGK